MKGFAQEEGLSTPSNQLRRPLFARFYGWVSPRMEPEGMGELRDELLAGVGGRVIEVGAGNGLNFSHYPPQTTEVLAVEPEPYLRGLAERAAAGAAVVVNVAAGDAGQLPAPNTSVDVGVISLVLCSVDDQHRALAELYRVIRPGGQLRFLEHVAAQTPALHRVQRLADATIWPLVAGGCHTARNTLAAIRDAGFEITTLRRLRFPDNRIPVPAAPHALGVAIRPDG